MKLNLFSVCCHSGRVGLITLYLGVLLFVSDVWCYRDRQVENLRPSINHCRATKKEKKGKSKTKKKKRRRRGW